MDAAVQREGLRAAAVQRCGAEESAEPWNVAQRRKRLKIQETLDQSTAVAGRGVFLEHYRQPWTDLQPRPIRRAPGPRSHEGVVIQA